MREEGAYKLLWASEFETSLLHTSETRLLGKVARVFTLSSFDDAVRCTEAMPCYVVLSDITDCTVTCFIALSYIVTVFYLKTPDRI